MLDPIDLIAPNGRIRLDLLDRTADELNADVEIWLKEAYAKVSVLAVSDTQVGSEDSPRDRLARLWAEYRYFDAGCIELALNPASTQEVDAATSRYDKDQRQTICGMAATAYAEFYALLPVSTIADPRPNSRAVTNNYEW